VNERQFTYHKSIMFDYITLFNMTISRKQLSQIITTTCIRHIAHKDLGYLSMIIDFIVNEISLLTLKISLTLPGPMFATIIEIF